MRRLFLTPRAVDRASLVDLTFVSGFFEKMGAEKTPAYIWGAIQTGVAAATLL